MLIDLPIVCVGFPSRIIIGPFLPWIQHRARRLRSQMQLHICVSWRLLSLMGRGAVPFVREDEHIWLTYNNVGVSGQTSSIGWATAPLKEVYDACDADIQSEIIVQHDDAGKYSGGIRAL